MRCVVKPLSFGKSSLPTPCTVLTLVNSAIETSKTLPLEAFAPDSLLKITGIYISLSALLESNGQHRRALQVMQEALAFLDRYDPERGSPIPATSTEFTLADRTRSIGLAQKIGTLALHISDPSGKDQNGQLAEQYLTRALEAMIKLASGVDGKESKLVGRDFEFPQQGGSQEVQEVQEDADVDGARLNKVTRKSMGITMEALADLYVRRGDHE